MRREKMLQNRLLDYGVIKSQIKGMFYYKRALKREPGITAQVKKAAKQAGMDMTGAEHRIKPRDSYLNKIRRKYDPEGSPYQVKDILRYTYTASGEELVEKISKVIAVYSDSGYNTVEVKNYWLDKQGPYNGINTTMRSPDGQVFELQYHTPESFRVKCGKMHELYEKQRLINDVSSKEYIGLDDQMFEMSDSMEVPKGVEKVKSHG